MTKKEEAIKEMFRRIGDLQWIRILQKVARKTAVKRLLLFREKEREEIYESVEELPELLIRE